MDDVERRAFASHARELRPMSAWWRQWAVWAGLSTEVVDSGELCLNEAVGNIIQHGGTRPDDRQPIVIILERDVTVVRMTIIDELGPFNPLMHPAHDAPTSLAQVEPGGLGIHLIRLNATDAQYRREEGRNVLTLLFHRSQQT